MPSRKRLIVNADDFGIHQAVNSGILKGHTAGCLTSASLMPGGESFGEAIEIANGLPGLGVGVHLTLVGEKPVGRPEYIASILDGRGCLYDNYLDFIKKYLRGGIDLNDVHRELKAQMKKVCESGLKIPLTHLDSHQHLHVLPGIIDIVIDLALEFNIRAIRFPGEGFFFRGGFLTGAGRIIGRSGLTALALGARRKIKKAGLVAPDNFFGMLAGGNLREEFLLNIIGALPPGISEIMIHPGDDDTALKDKYGWPYNWQAELAAALSPQVLKKIELEKIELITFGNI